jgi:hypothetical protein
LRHTQFGKATGCAISLQIVEKTSDKAANLPGFRSPRKIFPSFFPSFPSRFTQHPAGEDCSVLIETSTEGTAEMQTLTPNFHLPGTDRSRIEGRDSRPGHSAEAGNREVAQ